MPFSVDRAPRLALADVRKNRPIGEIGKDFSESVRIARPSDPAVATARIVNTAYPLNADLAGLTQIPTVHMHQARPVVIVALLA